MARKTVGMAESIDIDGLTFEFTELARLPATGPVE